MNQLTDQGRFAPQKPDAPILPQQNDAYGGYSEFEPGNSAPTPNTTPTTGRRRSLKDIFSKKSRKSVPASEEPPLPASVHNESNATAAATVTKTTTQSDSDIGAPIGTAISSTDYATGETRTTMPQGPAPTAEPAARVIEGGGPFGPSNGTAKADEPKAEPPKAAATEAPVVKDDRPARQIEGGGPWGAAGKPPGATTASAVPTADDAPAAADIAAAADYHDTEDEEQPVADKSIHNEEPTMEQKVPEQDTSVSESTALAAAGGVAAVSGAALVAGGVAAASTSKTEELQGVPSRSSRFRETPDEPDEPTTNDLKEETSQTRDLTTTEATPVISQDSQTQHMSADEFLEYLITQRHSKYQQTLDEEKEQMAREEQNYKVAQHKQKLKKYENRQSVGAKLASQFRPPVMREYIHKYEEGIGGIPYESSRAGEPPSAGTYPLHGNAVAQFPPAPSSDDPRRSKSVSSKRQSSAAREMGIPPGTAITTDSEIGQQTFPPASSPSRYSTDSRTPIADQFASSQWYRNKGSPHFTAQDAPPVPPLTGGSYSRETSPTSFYESRTPAFMADELAKPEPLAQGVSSSNPVSNRKVQDIDQHQTRDLGQRSEPSHSRQNSGHSSRGLEAGRVQPGRSSPRLRGAYVEDPSSIPPIPPLPSQSTSTELPTSPPERKSSRRHSRQSSKSKSKDMTQGGPAQLPNDTVVKDATDRPDLEGVVDLRNTEDVTYYERQAPAVVHETVQPVTHNITTESIEREIHTHEVHHRTLPIVDIQVLPAKHFVPDPSGNSEFKEVAASAIPGRAADEHENYNWIIAETVSGRSKVGDPSTNAVVDGTRRDFTARTFTGTEGDAEDYTTEDGVRHTKTTWVHPPRVAVAAQQAGETVPVYIGFDDAKGKQRETRPSGLTGPAGVMAPFPHKSLE